MIIGELKVGTAELNRAATNPAVLRAALMRFECCDHHDTGRVVDALLRTGYATNPAGRNVRMVAFGSTPPSQPHPPYQVILLRDILRFLRQYMRAHWPVLHHADFKDPAFSVLMMLEKPPAVACCRRIPHGSGLAIGKQHDYALASGRSLAPRLGVRLRWLRLIRSDRTLCRQDVALRREPVVNVGAMLTATIAETLVRASPDFLA